MSAWTVDFGAPLATVAWTAVLEDQAALAEAAWGLAGQDGDMDLIEAAADLVAAPGEDTTGWAAARSETPVVVDQSHRDLG